MTVAELLSKMSNRRRLPVVFRDCLTENVLQFPWEANYIPLFTYNLNVVRWDIGHQKYLGRVLNIYVRRGGNDDT